MSFAFTESQSRAIEDRGGSILVSAAAGSGKTRVLTERLIRAVTDSENSVDIDRFLVITYTRAAAAELRGGSIAADPWFRSQTENACRFCDYAEACHRTEDDHIRYLTKLKPEAVWELLEKGGDAK